MMKTIKYTVMAAAAIVLCSCNLDQKPYSASPVEGHITDLEGVNNLVIGTYNGLHSVLYYEWAVTELRSDNTRSRNNNSTSQDTKLIEQLDQGTITTAHSWVEEYWNACYATINRANNVLETLETVEYDREDAADVKRADRYAAEVRFIRAHLYFNLVRLWGPVFKITKSTSSAEARYIQRSPVEDIYELIEGDLNDIIDNELLPPPSQVEDDDVGRVTLQAAEALLAKVYMTRYEVGSEKYLRAGTLLDNVFTKYGNGWVDDYASIFSISNEMNDEIIFAVRYLSGNVGLGCPFGTLFGPSNNGNSVLMGSPKQYNYPSDDLIAAFTANNETVEGEEEGAADVTYVDFRKDVTLKETYFNKSTNEWVNNANSRWCDKFLSPITKEYDGENDWPVIRMGDIVLLLAEWENEINGPSQAFDYLNLIRERAGVRLYTSADLPTKREFREAVRNERRTELACENQRWFDLVRWGIAADVVSEYLTRRESFYGAYNYTVSPIAEWQVLLPIPVSVTNINPSVAQNPGY